MKNSNNIQGRNYIPLHTAYPVAPLTGEQSAVMFTMLTEPEREMPKEVIESFPYKVIAKRLDAAGVEVHTHVIAFIAMTLANNPGQCVMYAHSLFQLYRQNGFVDVKVLCEAYPMGFPTEAAMNESWESQKGNHPAGNWLDTAEAWT